jgi:hypothetical protein
LKPNCTGFITPRGSVKIRPHGRPGLSSVLHEIMGPQILQKSASHIQILGAARMTCSSTIQKVHKYWAPEQKHYSPGRPGTRNLCTPATNRGFTIIC